MKKVETQVYIGVSSSHHLSRDDSHILPFTITGWGECLLLADRALVEMLLQVFSFPGAGNIGQGFYWQVPR
jgi:hypothetical protein